MGQSLIRVIKIFLVFAWVALALYTLSSCAILPKIGGDNIQDGHTIVPKPATQLWQTARKSNWMITLAIPIIAFGAVATFNGMAKLGMSAAIFGCVNLFLALATARFAMVMAVFGLIGSCLVVAASILQKNKAITETIIGIQQADSKDVKDKLKEIHSKTTHRLINNVKTNLKLKGKL